MLLPVLLVHSQNSTMPHRQSSVAHSSQGAAGMLIVCSLLIVLFSLASGERFTITTRTVALSQARADMGSAAVGSLALFAGGRTNSSDSSASAVVDIYNAATNTWTTASLSEARHSLAATTVGSLALFAGGRRANGSESAVVDIYNATDDSWTVASLSQARSSLAATSIGGYLALFAGGELSQNATIAGVTSRVDIYNAHNNSWTTASLLIPRSRFAATSVGSLAVFAFGRNDVGVAGLSGAVDFYNATTNSWTNTNTTYNRHSMSAMTLGPLACFCGGRSTGSLGSIPFFNTTDGTFKTTGLSSARDSTAAVTIGSLGLVGGGHAGSTMAFATVDLYDSSKNEWSLATPLTQSRWGLRGAVVGNIVLFAGGFVNATSTSSVVDVYNISFTDVTPILLFNQSEVVLVPKDNQGSVRPSAALRLDFNGALRELDASGEIVQVAYSNSTNAGWTEVKPGPGINATESYLYSANLTFPGESQNKSSAAPRLQVQFYLFQTPTAIAIGDNVTLQAEPMFAKFSVRLTSWPWHGGLNNGTIEMRIRLAPTFSNYTEYNGGGLVTSLALAGQFDSSSQATTEIRLVHAVEVDGEVMTNGVQFSLNVSTSELVIRFPWFNSTLLYDPDLGVLFGAAEKNNGDSVPVGLIIGVSVAGASAIIIVVAVVAAFLAAVWIRRKRDRSVSMRSQVNFDYHDESARPRKASRTSSPMLESSVL